MELKERREKIEKKYNELIIQRKLIDDELLRLQGEARAYNDETKKEKDVEKVKPEIVKTTKKKNK